MIVVVWTANDNPQSGGEMEEWKREIDHIVGEGNLPSKEDIHDQLYALLGQYWDRVGEPDTDWAQIVNERLKRFRDLYSHPVPILCAFRLGQAYQLMMDEIQQRWHDEESQ